MVHKFITEASCSKLSMTHYSHLSQYSQNSAEAAAAAALSIDCVAPFFSLFFCFVLLNSGLNFTDKKKRVKSTLES